MLEGSAMNKITTEEMASEYLHISDLPLESHLGRFHEIKGYKASALTNYNGDIIAFDSIDENINAQKMGRFFCQMFNYTDTEISKNGFIGCVDLQMLLGDNLFLIFGTERYSLITTRLVLLLSKDGNFPLVKINANKIIGALMNSITFLPENYLLYTQQ